VRGSSGSGGWAGTCASAIAACLETLFDTFLVLPVAEMDFEVVDRHARAGGVQLSGAIVAADTWEILVFDVLAVLEVVGVGHGGQGFCVDGGITHYAFE
jgi:hypothetical protein